MYNDKREQNSITSSIILSSFYSDKILPEEGSLKERILFEKTSLRPIASVSIEATKKNKLL